MAFTDVVEAWLRDHPGFYEPNVIAAALDCDNHGTANTLMYLTRRGRVVRTVVEAHGRKRAYYGIIGRKRT